MGKVFFVLLIATFCILNLSSCYYDSEEALYPFTFCDTASISYESQIKTIVALNCESCHNSGNASGNVRLDTYDFVMNATKNGKLLCAIQKNSGCSPMPPTGAGLNTCDINKIKAWSLNNYK